MDLTGSTPSHVFDPPTDIESEYFTTGDQVATTCGAEGIRVTYEDHSKTYIPKIRAFDNYRFYLNLTMPSDEESGDEPITEEFLSLSPENQEKQREDWAKELSELDRELDTLDKQLRVNLRHVQMLKRKLGLTAWREFSEDMEEGMRRFKDSPMFKKVEQTLIETMTELANLVISVDNFMIETVEKVGEGVEKVIVMASEEIQRATKISSDGLLNAQRKTSHSLQKLGVIDPPELYSKEDIPGVIEDHMDKEGSTGENS